MKASGELAFGQVPALKVEAAGAEPRTLVQTAAIARYIGRLAGPGCSLYPEDPAAAAEVDAVVDQAADMMCPILCAKYQERFGFDGALGGPDSEATKAVEAALQTSVMPRHFGFLEGLLAASATGWLAGGEGPTIADFVMGAQVQQLGQSAMVKGEELMAGHPKVAAFVEKLMGLPAVKAWYAKRGG
mmetsp:Transcript_46840/g.144708  ORF Transcript_46840/g.144708 Transcript_46840/m.144708 type:complete len:187 (+) Transcript_46840:573-1133(+)